MNNNLDNINGGYRFYTEGEPSNWKSFKESTKEEIKKMMDEINELFNRNLRSNNGQL